MSYTLAISSSIAQQVAQVVEESVRVFLQVNCQRECLKMPYRPQAAARQGQRIGTGGQRLAVPGGWSEWNGRLGERGLGEQHDQREEVEERRSRAGNRQRRLLALSPPSPNGPASRGR